MLARRIPTILPNLTFEESIFGVEKEITIKSITTSIIDGNTYYYIIDNDDQKYKASIKVNENVLPFLNSGNSIKVKYGKLKNVIDIIGIE